MKLEYRALKHMEKLVGELAGVENDLKVLKASITTLMATMVDVHNQVQSVGTTIGEVRDLLNAKPK